MYLLSYCHRLLIFKATSEATSTAKMPDKVKLVKNDTLGCLSTAIAHRCKIISGAAFSYFCTNVFTRIVLNVSSMNVHIVKTTLERTLFYL